ncbi:MAG: hypothetical protein NTW19_01810 [Planctomycetota bacterium]|nr:hypothetical protein [Planctomycetota bacterium]
MKTRLPILLGLAVCLGFVPGAVGPAWSDEPANSGSGLTPTPAKTRPLAEPGGPGGPGGPRGPRDDKARPPKSNDSVRHDATFDSDGNLRDGPALSPEQMKEAIAILHEIDPAKAQRLEAWLKTNPDAAKGVVMPAMPKLMQLGFLKRHNPEMYQLRLADMKLTSDTEELAKQYKQASEAKDPKAAGLQTQMRAKLVEHFTLRQKIQEAELAALEKRIAELRELIAARKTSQDQLIQDRFDELITRPNRPEW